MKRLISLLLTAVLLALTPCGMFALAASNSMSYTDADLKADDNSFAQTIHTTIGRGDVGTNNYCAQSFVPTVDYVTGCRLHFRLGDNATMTVQIRTSLTGGNESILYSANYPLVSDPHNITGWWDFDFTRAVKLTKGQTYYLVFWCDIYHSYCIASTTQYIANNLVNTSYRKAENLDEWSALNKRSFGYELLSDPNAEVTGFPYAIDDNALMLHHAEEFYCFNRKGANTTLDLNDLNSSQGYFSMKATGGAKDKDGNLLSAYVDFDTVTDFSNYQYYYADVFVSRAVTENLNFKFSLLDKSGNGLTYSSPLQNFTKGWHRIIMKAEDMTAVGNGSVRTGAQAALQITGDSYPADLYFSFDNLRSAVNPIATVTSTYYTDQELNVPSVDGSADDVDYIGKPDSTEDITFGDVNQDTKINSIDALKVLRCAVNKETPTGMQFKIGDVNVDNKLNATDALLILKYAVKKIDSFPADKLVEDNAAIEEFHITTDGLTKNTIYKISTSNLNRVTGGLMAHDVVRLASSLQGLINRDLEKNRIALVIVDDYTNTWLSYIQENDTLLDGMTRVDNITSLNEFFTTFAAQIKDCGMTLWDPNAPATANVAATICGIEGNLPVKYDTTEGSLYNMLVEMGVETNLSLVDKFTGEGLIPDTTLLSTGSVKCDPYLWALEKYSQYCSDTYLIYVPDGASATKGNIIYEQDEHSKSMEYNKLYNHDYGIYRKAFFFDLTAVDSEAPCDDPEQALGTDLATLQAILTNRYYRANGAFGEVVGFPPWQLKYSTHNNWGSVGATTVEATFTEEVTKFNCYLDADGSITNCSIYTQFTLEDSYESIANAKPVTEVYDENTMYLYMYTGDYDSSAWALEHMYRSYNDSARGSIPITWSFTPALANRIPMVFDYMYKNQTENDYFSASDSGIGYVRPQGLFQSESDRTLPDGDKEFIKLSKEWFDKFDLDSVGFIIGKLSDKVCSTYNQFAPIGSGTNDSAWTPAVYNGAPYMRIKNGIGDPAYTDAAMETAVSGMYDFAREMRVYGVASFRTIKFTAGDLKRTQEAFIEYAAQKDPNTTYKFVDYKTYFAMMKEAANGRYTLD